MDGSREERLEKGGVVSHPRSNDSLVEPSTGVDHMIGGSVTVWVAADDAQGKVRRPPQRTGAV